MNINKKRKAGEVLGRGGISQRIIELSKDIAEGSYKNAIEKAGRISVLVESATFDEYWNEKAKKGKQNEEYLFLDLIDGWINKDNAICNVDPYKPVAKSNKS